MDTVGDRVCKAINYVGNGRPCIYCDIVILQLVRLRKAHIVVNWIGRSIEILLINGRSLNGTSQTGQELYKKKNDRLKSCILNLCWNWSFVDVSVAEACLHSNTSYYNAHLCILCIFSFGCMFCAPFRLRRPSAAANKVNAKLSKRQSEYCPILHICSNVYFVFCCSAAD